MKVIDFESVKQVEKMNPAVWCEWVDDALREKAEFVCPPKPRMSQTDGDYFNVMPVMYENKNIAIVKMIGRHGLKAGGITRSVMRSDMPVYNADTGILNAVMDAEYVTTLCTGQCQPTGHYYLARKTSCGTTNYLKT